MIIQKKIQDEIENQIKTDYRNGEIEELGTRLGLLKRKFNIGGKNENFEPASPKDMPDFYQR